MLSVLQELRDDLYMANLHEQQKVVDLRWMKKGDRKSKWTRGGADTIMYPTVDMILLQHMQTRGIQLNDLYRPQLGAALMRRSNIIVKRPSEDTWFATAIDVDNMCVMQPLVEDTALVSGRKTYRIQTDDSMKALHTDFIFYILYFTARTYLHHIHE